VWPEPAGLAAVPAAARRRGYADARWAGRLELLRTAGRDVLLDGAQTVTTPRAPNTGSMPAYAGKLSDQEIADVATYIRNSWGNAAPPVTPGQVRKARQ